jgi:hypothetical protein
LPRYRISVLIVSTTSSRSQLSTHGLTTTVNDVDTTFPTVTESFSFLDAF